LSLICGVTLRRNQTFFRVPSCPNG
jgi:hypothetical protein